MTPVPATIGEGQPGGSRMLVLRGARGMQALEREWKVLARAAQPPNPFLWWEWQASWVESVLAPPPDVSPAGDPRPRFAGEPCIVAETFPSGALAGLLAVQCVRRHGLLELEFLGHGSGADDLDCLLHPAAPDGIARRLLRTALALNSWRLLRLDDARRGSALALAVANHRRSKTWTQPGEWLPFLDLPRDLDTLLDAHSANFRAQIRRRRRHFVRAAPNATVVVCERAADIDDGLDHLFRLHALRRAQRHGAAAFGTRAERDFHRRAGRRLAASGAARLYLMRTPTAVIAALYGFAAGGRFFYFQSGFDPAWTAYSPGTVLMSHVLEDCMRRGEWRFEFLRGDEYYKSRWTVDRRRALNLRGHRGFAGAAHSWLAACARRLRPTAPSAE